MPTIEADTENNAETWWDAASNYSESKQNSTFTRIFGLLKDNDTIEVSAEDLEEFVLVAARLPGWDNGSWYAPHPVLYYP